MTRTLEQQLIEKGLAKEKTENARYKRRQERFKTHQATGRYGKKSDE